MKPQTIGIVGGAGPLAGVALLERFFTYAREVQIFLTSLRSCSNKKIQTKKSKTYFNITRAV